MTRSIKKGPFVEERLLKKIEGKNPSNWATKPLFIVDWTVTPALPSGELKLERVRLASIPDIQALEFDRVIL